MIVEYSDKYCEDVKDLFVELQEYIVALDKEKYNIMGDDYRDKYFEETMTDISKNSGKMYLYVEEEKVLGLVVGVINNEEVLEYDFCAPRRGRVSELIVSSKYRSKGVGHKLLEKIEEYLHSMNCQSILIEVFGYNEGAISFYNKKGYHTRVVEVIKTS